MRTPVLMLLSRIWNFNKKHKGVKSHFSNFLPPSGYSLYKQRESWNTPCLREESPAPPLFIEEVARSDGGVYFFKLSPLLACPCILREEWQWFCDWPDEWRPAWFRSGGQVRNYVVLVWDEELSGEVCWWFGNHRKECLYPWFGNRTEYRSELVRVFVPWLDIYPKLLPGVDLFRK